MAYSARAASGTEAAAFLPKSELPSRLRGRGSTTNPPGRFDPLRREPVEEAESEALKTEVVSEKARRIITSNDSPDIVFERSINPYRGCEHGCVYCFARPTHSFLGLSPGLDFETKLFAKTNAAELLEKELSAPGYTPRVIALGANTDPYQPVERTYRITRGVLEVLKAAQHPVGIVTKAALVTRDIDLLAPMAQRHLAKVAISLTTLDSELARKLEPRAASPAKRLETIRALTQEGIPVVVMVAPVIPAINEHEIERLLDAAYDAGAREAGYVLLRLPHELDEIMQDWLSVHEPGKQRHVMSLIREMRGGKAYDSSWNSRMTGSGPYAWMIGRRFEIAARRCGYNVERQKLRKDLFIPPVSSKGQLNLFANMV